MLCPLFKNQIIDDWCLRQDCRYFDRDIEACVYETYQRLKAEPTDDEDDGSDEVTIHAV